MRESLKKLRDPILIQAVIAAALSFSHIHDIADAAGQREWKAWAYPISVDLLMVMAWKMIRTDAKQRGAWFWFGLSLSASLGANVATAGVLDLGNLPVWLRVLVAGWPAVAFLGGAFMVHAQSKQKPAVEDLVDDVEEDQEPDEVEEPEPEEDELVTVAEAHARTGVNIRTARTWVWRGQLPVKGMRGRANLVSLRDVKERMTVGA
ncbi:DUF2637 domain-containing protein [Streptomyces sp. NBC_00197]|uniref:DUF2637 domain-containing protein n=1 Tax=Streptomyces sp. NBC_00197 TaxID=2975676 RepID=UPI0032518BB6